MIKLTKKQQTLLAFLAASADVELDPIRIMKGLFLLAQEAKSSTLAYEDKYEFVPFNYGPCSFEVYRDLDYLRSKCLIKQTRQSAESWFRYSITEDGLRVFASLDLNVHLNKYIRILNEFVRSLSFADLLKVVYAEYPDFAVKSVFQY